MRRSQDGYDASAYGWEGSTDWSWGVWFLCHGAGGCASWEGAVPAGRRVHQMQPGHAHVLWLHRTQLPRPVLCTSLGDMGSVLGPAQVDYTGLPGAPLGPDVGVGMLVDQASCPQTLSPVVVRQVCPTRPGICQPPHLPGTLSSWHVLVAFILGCGWRRDRTQPEEQGSVPYCALAFTPTTRG